MDAGVIIVGVIALVELIMIIGLKMVIKERDIEIVILKNAEKSAKRLLRKRRIPANEDGVFDESGED